MYREILARAHAALANRMPATLGITFYKQQEVDLCKRILLSTQHLDLELRLCDIFVADYEYALAQIADCEPGKGKAVVLA